MKAHSMVACAENHSQRDLPESALIVVETDHRLADTEPLKAMVEAVERAGQYDEPVCNG